MSAVVNNTMILRFRNTKDGPYEALLKKIEESNSLISVEDIIQMAFNAGVDRLANELNEIV